MDSTSPFQPWATNEGAKKDRELVDDAKLRENVNHPKHTQTASYDKESSAVAAGNVPGPSSAAPLGTDEVSKGKEGKMDSSKISSMQHIVENTLSAESRQRVSQLIEAVEALTGAEKLLLYLRLPTGSAPHDPLKQPVNPLGSRAELQQTVTWIQTHLEVDPEVSLPKQDVYDEYIAHCMSCNMKPLSTADFGKVMKQVYPTVRPRRLGTRGNSRYCYAGLRKKIKLEVPQLPDLGESSKETAIISSENERVICDWAETKLGIKLSSLSELSRHLSSGAISTPRLPPASPPPLTIVTQPTVPSEEPTSRQWMKQLKRKIQTHGTPGRPKKYKGGETSSEVSPSSSYSAHPHLVKHEGEPDAAYAYGDTYATPYDARQYPYRAHDYRPEYYEGFAPPDPALNVPINLSTDATLDLSTERANWQRRRPPEPPPPQPTRLPLPGKKLILETYQSETQRPAVIEPRPPPPPEPFPRAEYLPKKMRAAEIMGGKLAAARQSLAIDTATPGSSTAEPTASTGTAFLEDPKNVSNRSKSTAAALVREEREAASVTRPQTAARAPRPPHDACCGLDCINTSTGMICQEKHSEILNRERVISICNIDKHDLDDYLNEGNSQENEEELLQYFQQRDANARNQANSADAVPFLETSMDHQDDHSQGKNEKICQLRALLAKNLKNQSGSNFHTVPVNGNVQNAEYVNKEVSANCEVAFKPVADAGAATNMPMPEATNYNNKIEVINSESRHETHVVTSIAMPVNHTTNHLYNGNSNNVPQSPTTRTQQYDFVPISEGCHSPQTFNSKSPLGFVQRSISPKINKSTIMGGSLQTSPVSHSTAASPFVSPRNTPVPRSRCSRPIPKHNNGRKRRCPLNIGINDLNQKPFVIPNDQKFMKSACVSGMKYQPMSAPPSPNIITSQLKSHMFQSSTPISNGNGHMSLNFFNSRPFRDNVNGDISQPSSADPLSNEVSQFFQEPLVLYRPEHDTAFRSQSVPLKQGVNSLGLLYNKTPVGSVPPTPVPNEFCDFGSLADTCDIMKAGLNSENLDKIYHAIDSSTDVLSSTATPELIETTNVITNGCSLLPEQEILPDELNSFIPNDGLLDRNSQFNHSFSDGTASSNHVEDFLKRTNSLDFNLTELDTDKNKFYVSRSVPSTPVPYKRGVPNLHIESRRARELFATNNYVPNGISSKSVPSTPQLIEEKTVFSYSNRDFLINGNSVELCNSNHLQNSVVENSQPLSSPLHEILREDILEPLTPAADLLADLDKIEGTPYGDL